MTHRPRVFLLDENIPKKVLSLLRTVGYMVTRVQDELLTSQPDSAVFIHARARQMVIITFDTDYLSQTKFPPPHAGILVLRFFQRDASMIAIATAVLNAVVQLDAFDLSNRVYVIKPDEVNEVNL